MSDWQPNASIEHLKQRSQLIQSIRNFFKEKGVWEAETPALSQYSVTDQHLHSFETQFAGPGFASGCDLYLQTSPEYAMKRLLAAGSGCIFQISKAFRNEESGRFHNPEFTMLEWYRVGFDDKALMKEVAELLQHVLSVETTDGITYQQAFIQYLATDPLEADIHQLQQLAHSQGFEDLSQQLNDKDDLLQLLFSQCIEPIIGQQVPCFVYNFPASQAALACISQEDPRVAERFEVYYKGIELANGFHELTDHAEQALRFQSDNHKRQLAGLASKPIDHRFIAALQHGLPACAGVALGLDRLAMLALDADHIDKVISFSIKRA